MILAIDAGNSTVDFGFFEGDELAHVFSAQTRAGATSDEYRAFLYTQMGLAGLAGAGIEGVALSCVVARLVPVFFETLGGITDAAPLIVSHRLKLGINVGYGTPETLGADRLASACAAYAEHGGPVIVADFGTATTFSVVDGSGTFLGGAIAPGLLTGYEALTRNAAGLPKVGLTFPRDPLGGSTAEGIQAGVIFGHAAMVDGMLERLRASLGEDARAVATGGLAGLVAPHAKSSLAVEKHLVLKGLLEIYRLNADN